MLLMVQTSSKKLKKTWTKLKPHGKIKSSSSPDGAKLETMSVFWREKKCRKFKKNSKKTLWPWLLWMRKDMLHLSKEKSKNKSKFSLKCKKPLKDGSRFKSCGHLWKLCSQVVILLNKCLRKLKSLQVLIKNVETHGKSYWN